MLILHDFINNCNQFLPSPERFDKIPSPQYDNSKERYHIIVPLPIQGGPIFMLTLSPDEKKALKGRGIILNLDG